MFLPTLQPPIIPGETLPFHEFEKELRAHADRMGRLVLQLTGVFPSDMAAILGATSEDIHCIQQERRMTHLQLEQWAVDTLGALLSDTKN